jgi:hypothetical protein
LGHITLLKVIFCNCKNCAIILAISAFGGKLYKQGEKMKKLLVLLLALTLVACGGSQPVPTSEPQAPVVPTPRPTTVPTATTHTGSTENGGTETGGETEPAPGEPAAVSEEESGIDTETGLLLNPDQVFTGVEFVVKGKIVSMNLTPQERPEFVLQAPSGKRYRIRSQSLAETFATDGRQLKAFEYRQGMMAKATVILPLGSTSTDILVSQNLVLLLDN